MSQIYKILIYVVVSLLSASIGAGLVHFHHEQHCRFPYIIKNDCKCKCCAPQRIGDAPSR